MTTFHALTIRAKLALAFGLLTLMVVLVSVFAFKAQSDADRAFTDYVQGVSNRAILAEQVRTAVDQRAIAARDMVIVTKQQDLEKQRATVLEAHERVTTRLKRLTQLVERDTHTTDKSRVLVQKMNQVESLYGPVALSIVDFAYRGNKDAAMLKINDECRPLLEQLVSLTIEYREHTAKFAEAAVTAAAARNILERNVLIAVCLLATLIAIGSGWVLIRSLARALGAEPLELNRVAHAIADGNLHPIPGVQQAPKDSVLASLGFMQTSLSAIVQNVRSSSDSIATGASEIATGNADLSHRTEQQASELQETAATMGQLGGTVRNNAESAAKASHLAQDASEVADRGGLVVQQVVATMRDINQSSAKISDIIGVIDGIAFQTNILSLNAAVEAARAGEQGKGFAVVATEVRNLAQRSAGAAKEIKALIEHSVQQVSQGSKLVDQAGQTMHEIVASIQHVNTIVREISAASVEQSAGVTQIGQAVARMDQVTLQNAALVEQSAAAASSLSQQAQQLVESVQVFQLSDALASQGALVTDRVIFSRKAALSAPVQKLVA